MLLALLAALSHASPVRCLTPEFLALRDAPLDGARFFRPDAAGYVDSALYPLRLHYADPAEADRVLNVLLPLVEEVWEIEILQMGWPTPPPDAGTGGSDAYDFYFTTQGTLGGAYTWGFGDDLIPDDNWYSNSTFIAVDSRIADADMGPFIAHEFMHALQWTIDGKERTIFVWESTAEAITDIVYDDTDYAYELYSFQQLPFLSLLFDSYNPLTYPYGYTAYYYEYGGLLFPTYLEEKYGNKDGSVILKLWDDLAQPGSTDEPDFLDAVALVDPAIPSVAAAYTDFSVWRMFAAGNDDGAHFEEGATFPDYAIVVPEDTLELAEVDGYVATPALAPYDLGASYYLIDLGKGTDATLHVEVAGAPGAQWGLVWAVWMTAGGPAATGSTFVADGQPLALDVDLTGGYQAEIGVINNGPDGLDPNLDDPERRNFTLTLTLVDAALPGDTDVPPVDDTDAPVNDTDAPPEDDGSPKNNARSEEPAGCGCASAQSGPLVAPLLLGLLALRRRAGVRADRER